MSLGNRLIVFLFYLGFTIFPPSRLSEKFKKSILHEHYCNALTISFISICCFIIALFIWVIGLISFAKYSPQSLETETFILPSIIFVLLFGLILWLIHVIGSLFGKNIKIFFVSKLNQVGRMLSVSYFIHISFLLMILIAVLISVHSLNMSINPQKPAKGYMLYDDMGFVPKWVFTLGFYRVQLAAQSKWGVGNVSIEPISHESLKEALSNASFIFLAVHGYGSYGEEYAGHFRFYNETHDKVFFYGPDQIKSIGVGKNLKFVYLAACYGGSLEKEWSEVFNPAKIKSFNRISVYPEHIYWLWIKLPNILKYSI